MQAFGSPLPDGSGPLLSDNLIGLMESQKVLSGLALNRAPSPSLTPSEPAPAGAGPLEKKEPRDAAYWDSLIEEKAGREQVQGEAAGAAAPSVTHSLAQRLGAPPESWIPASDNANAIIETCKRNPLCGKPSGHRGACKLQAKLDAPAAPDAPEGCERRPFCTLPARHKGWCRGATLAEPAQHAGAAAEVTAPAAEQPEQPEQPEEQGVLVDVLAILDPDDLAEQPCALPIEPQQRQQPKAASPSLEADTTKRSPPESEAPFVRCPKNPGCTKPAGHIARCKVPAPARAAPRGGAAEEGSRRSSRDSQQPSGKRKAAAALEPRTRLRTSDGEAAAAAEVASTLAAWGAQAPRKPLNRLHSSQNHDAEPRGDWLAAPPLGDAELARGGSPGAAAAAASLVQTCRSLEQLLARCGLTIEEQLCYTMDFAALPAVVQAAQWDAVRRHQAGGNAAAVAACVRRLLAK